MAVWTGERTGRFFTRYIDWKTWQEGEDFPYMTGGKVELTALTSLKANGNIAFDGKAPDPSKLLRILYTFTDANGDTETVPVATMMLEVSKDTRTDVSSQGTAKLSSVLSVLADRHYGEPFSVPKGTDAVALAVELCESCGLRTSAAPSAYRTSKAHAFAEGDSDYLTIINWLLDAAGYASARPDAYGVVQLSPYAEPTDRPTSFTFKPGLDSVMMGEVEYESDLQSAPNAVRLYYTSQEEALSSWALNIDTNHPASIPNRGGREKTSFETISQLEGATQLARSLELDEMARSRLLSSSAEVEYVEVGCPFLPILPDMAIEVKYAGMDWRGSVTAYNINLGDDSATTVRARRFIRRNLAMETGSAVIWSA